MPTPDDWTKAKYDAVLAAGAHAISRARYVFIVLNVTGIVVLVGLFNSTAPWLRNAIYRAKHGPAIPDHLQHIQKTLYQDLWTVTAPLLGLKISVFDLVVIGTLALFVVAVWQYYATRREHSVVRIICKFSYDALKSNERTAAEYLYHGIAHYFVFTTRLNRVSGNAIAPKPTPSRVVQALILMPAWIPALIVASELFTIYVPYAVALEPTKPFIQTAYPEELAEEGLRLLFAMLLGWWSFILCRAAIALDVETRNYLRPLIDEFQI